MIIQNHELQFTLSGAPLGIFVSPFKEMSKEGAQIWLEDCRQSYKGIAGSNILFDVPDETLYINPEGTVLRTRNIFIEFILAWILQTINLSGYHGYRLWQCNIAVQYGCDR